MRRQDSERYLCSDDGVVFIERHKLIKATRLVSSSSKVRIIARVRSKNVTSSSSSRRNIERNLVMILEFTKYRVREDSSRSVSEVYSPSDLSHLVSATVVAPAALAVVSRHDL